MHDCFVRFSNCSAVISLQSGWEILPKKSNGFPISTSFSPLRVGRNLVCFIDYITNKKKKGRGKCPCQIFYPAVSSMFSMKMPYPMAGLFTSTWVTAPTSLPFWIMGEPDTSVSSRGQKKFAEKLRFYHPNTQKRGFYIGQLKSLS